MRAVESQTVCREQQPTWPQVIPWMTSARLTILKLRTRNT
jgi:hypothetical protein